MCPENDIGDWRGYSLPPCRLCKACTACETRPVRRNKENEGLSNKSWHTICSELPHALCHIKSHILPTSSGDSTRRANSRRRSFPGFLSPLRERPLRAQDLRDHAAIIYCRCHYRWPLGYFARWHVEIEDINYFITSHAFLQHCCFWWRLLWPRGKPYFVKRMRHKLMSAN